MNDLVFGWIVVPGILVSAVASVANVIWTHYSTRDLKRLESRLRRSEVAQSPRVAAAIELWVAFGRFDDAIEKALYSSTFNMYEAPTTEDIDKLMEGDAHVRKAKEDLQAAWKELTPTLSKAELLLDPTTYAPCAELFNAYDSAYSEAALARELGDPPALRHEREKKHRAERDRCRGNALAALQELIGTESK